MAPETGEPALSGPPLSALGVALIRARESSRPDRLYDDPYARSFVDAARRAFLEAGAAARWEQIESLANRFYPGRTVGVRLVDDHLRRVLAEGCTQVVLVGAGLDTRPMRLTQPAGVQWFEVDLAALFAFKEPVLAAAGAGSGSRHVVPTDLHGDWLSDLGAAGFRPDLPAAWVEEGVGAAWDTLTAEAITAASRPGSTWWRLAMTTSAGTADYRRLRTLVGAPDDPSAPESGPLGTGWTLDVRRWDDLTAPLGRPEAFTGSPSDGAVVATRI